MSKYYRKQDIKEGDRFKWKLEEADDYLYIMEIGAMSDRWLNNIRKKFKGNPISEPIITEIERRKQIRRKPRQ